MKAFFQGMAATHTVLLLGSLAGVAVFASQGSYIAAWSMVIGAAATSGGLVMSLGWARDRS